MLFASQLGMVAHHAMHRVMGYCKATPNRGWNLKPESKWEGKYKSFKFRIHGLADSDYAKCPITRRSVSGYSTLFGRCSSIREECDATCGDIVCH